MKTRIVVVLSVLSCLSATVLAQDASQRVPVIGCPADGQVGPRPAPAPSGAMAAISARVGTLNFFRAAEGIRVLAPRGWHCFSVYGSNGQTLYVAPLAVPLGFGSKLSEIHGPLIVVSESATDTSGRFSAAQTVARVFPKLRSYVQQVMSEGLVPQESFVFRPYDADKLTYHGDDVVEFVTAAGGKGMGDDAGVVADAGQTVRGVVIAANDEVILAAVRMPDDMSDIAIEVVRQLMREGR